MSESPTGLTFDEAATPSRKSHKVQPSSSSNKPKRTLTRSASTEPTTPSSTKSTATRWNSIRQHVMPSQNHPIEEMPGHKPTPSSSSSWTPSRGQSQKNTRYASKYGGVYQVVKTAVEYDEETRKFEQTIRHACWVVRSNAEAGHLGSQQQPSHSSSTLNLPFMSSSSLSTMNNTIPPSPTTRKDARRPQSIFHGIDKSKPGASILPLNQCLSRFSSMASPDALHLLRLPSESLVLSTLCYPFFAYRPGIEEERGLALQAFDVLLRTWNPVDEVAAGERALFCMKVVLLLCPSSTPDPSIPSQTPLRVHALNILHNLIVSEDTFYPAYNPRTFVTLMHGLFTLLPAVQRCEALQAQGHSQTYNPETQIPEEKHVLEMITKVKGGSCGDLDGVSLEQEYNVLLEIRDDVSTVRDVIALEAWAKCIESGSNELRRALIRRGVEMYWNQSNTSGYTPLMAAVKTRVLCSVTRAVLSLLAFTNPSATVKAASSSSSPISSPPITPSSSYPSYHSIEQVQQLREVDGTLIIWAMQTRVVPELDTLQAAVSQFKSRSSADFNSVAEGVDEANHNVARIALELLVSRPCELVQQGQRFSAGDGIGQLVNWSLSQIGSWCRDKDGCFWDGVFLKVLESIVKEGPWNTVLQVTRVLADVLPDDIRKPVMFKLIPFLHDRLQQSPPVDTSPEGSELTALMEQLSRTNPQLFYKPLFTLAATLGDKGVSEQLRSLGAISKWLPDFWAKDFEMIAVAVMSDTGGGAKGRMQPTSSLPHVKREYGLASLGQSVILAEVIGQIQKARRAREAPTHSSGMSDRQIVEIAKFAVALETRFALLIEVKEKTALIPMSQRLLFMLLFREIRLLTKSLKSARWLPRFIGWYVDYHKDREELEDEMALEIALIQEAYVAAKTPNNNRNTMTPVIDIPKDQVESDLFADKADLLKGLSKGFGRRALKLMVALSALIRPDEYARIGTLLWENHMEETDPSVLSSVCFLINQCAEKTPLDLLANIEIALRSLDDSTRLRAIRHFNTLVGWRFQIMAQPLVTDRSHRPFKMARTPLQFVATDMGSSLFVLELDPNDGKDKKLPLELRKQLAEMGWESDDNPVNQQLEWIRTPMSNLPPLQIDRSEGPAADSPLPSPSPLSSPKPLEADKAAEIALLRRNSSSGGPLAGLKRRAIFVPTLGQLLPRVAAMMYDPNVSVASATRALVVDLMRNDPGLLTRSIWDLISGDEHDFTKGIMTISAFLHVRHILPPAMSHTMFNHLAGFLKYTSKQVETQESLHKYALIMPLMAKLVTQVNNMSIREMRKAKLETFFIPSGSLWFPSSASTGPMFPRGLAFNNPFEDEVSERLISTTVVRIAQNMLFYGMLKRNPAEVQVVRKNMVRLVLPSAQAASEATPLELKDFSPVKSSRPRDPVPLKIRGLSQVLSRTYLLLVAQIFRCLSRHLNDRNDLTIMIDGINRILLEHGTDIGIVSHALIALMVASTRFRRLFASGGGYLLFMPAIFKVYAQSEGYPGIRHAIEYAVTRFYNHHQETFIFQSLSAISQVLVLPGVDGAWAGTHVYSLFASLHKNPHNLPDEAGIHDVNKSFEREALMLTTVEEKPQVFLAALRGKDGQHAKPPAPTDLIPEPESKRISADDLVRLFLTVIAHDISIARAEQFLKLLRFLAPHLYGATSAARRVLQNGIDALGGILSRVVKTKQLDPTATQVNETLDTSNSVITNASNWENQLAEKSREPSDLTEMRMDYLHLVAAFTSAGGKMTGNGSRLFFDAVKNVLRDAPNGVSISDAVSTVLGRYLRSSLIDQADSISPKIVVYILRDLTPIISAHATILDLSSTFTVIAELTEHPAYLRVPAFSQVVVGEICEAAVGAFEQAALDKQLHRISWRPSFVRLMECSMVLPGEDFVAQLRSRHKPSYELLLYIILPLAMSMKTAADLDLSGRRVDPGLRSAQTRAWIRLLLYTMECCENGQVTGRVGAQTSTPSLGRSRSRDRNASTDAKAQLRLLMIGVQIVKVLVVKGAKDLTACLPEVWIRLGALFKSLLADGNAEFTLQIRMDNSPTPSPRASAQFDFTSQTLGSTNTASVQNPRFVDYCLWSICEFVCVYRTPLFIQMRSFMHEKVRSFDNARRYLSSGLGSSSLNSRRRPTSVFSKPRVRYSNTPSPEGSPMLRAVTPFDHSQSDISLRPDSLGVGVGYHSFSSPSLGSPEPSSTSSLPGPPKIVHLGLQMLPGNRKAGSGAGSGGVLTDSAAVKSMSLIRQTYDRIRGVQRSMGYPPLDDVEGSTRGTEVWTKLKALREIVRETRELMEEFDEGSAADSFGVISVGSTSASEGVFVNSSDS